MKKIYIILLALMVSASTFAQAPQKMSYQAIVRNANNNLVTSHVVGMRISILQGTATGTAVYTETQTPTTNANGLVSIEIGNGTLVSGSFTGIDWAAGPYFIKTETDPIGSTSYTITGTSQLLSVPYALYATKSGNGFSGNYSDLTSKPVLATVATSGSYTDLTSKPSLFDGSWASLTGKPTFATIATTGSYNDLTNKPTLFNGSWASITSKPTTVSGYGITDAVNITDNQSIAGNKTFTGTISASSQTITNVASPVNNTDAANKAYVDAVLNKILQMQAENGVTDFDGNHYKAVKIGLQVWMAENLKTTKYADGTSIPLVNTTGTWGALTATMPAYCWYNDNITNSGTYGALYTWTAATKGVAYTTTNIQGVCPTGWHMPNIAEWNELLDFLGATTAGGKMKETGTTLWNSPNVGATNESGFSARPAGIRGTDGLFMNMGVYTMWHSSSNFVVVVTNGSASIAGASSGYNLGYSVRCLRD